MEHSTNSDSHRELEETMLRTPLLRRIGAYLKRSGMPPTRFGRLVAGDPGLVTDLRRGRQLGPVLEKRVTAWLDARDAETEDSKCSR
jgi:hypothetical protein